MSAPYRNSNLGLAAQLVKIGPVSLHTIHVENPNGAKSYVQFYNKATAEEVNPGTTTPDKTLYVPANGAMDFNWGNPVSFSNGLVIAATTGADNGVAPTSGLLVNIDYVRG